MGRTGLFAMTLLTAAAVGCGPGVAADDPGSNLLPECTAELDGILDVHELPMAPGISVRYVRNALDQPAAFEVGGTHGADGHWYFDEGPADIGATLTLLDPADTPHGDEFPGATYAAPLLVESPSVLGYFALETFEDGTGQLVMLGMAIDDGVDPASHTLLRYDDPLLLYPFPMAVGDSWTQTVTYRDAVAFGVPNQGVETYRFDVDELTTVHLPGGTEASDALVLSVEIDQTLALSAGPHLRTVHQRIWLRPCFGEVARAVSGDPEFEVIDELRRVYP